MTKPIPSPGSSFDNIMVTAATIKGDILFLWDQNKSIHAYDLKSHENNEIKIFHLDNLPITKTTIPADCSYHILETKDKIYLRNEKNEAIENSEDWTDFFFEKYSQEFYRKTKKGLWVDMKNHVLNTPIFLVGDVLVSLVGKKSIKALNFEDENIIASKNLGYIQIGKVVFNQQLEQQYYQDERISGILDTRIEINPSAFIIGVKLGYNRTGFIREVDGLPFLCRGLHILNYKYKFTGTSDQFLIFSTSSQEVCWSIKKNDFLTTTDGRPLALDFSQYHIIGEVEFVKGFEDGIDFYWNLQNNSKLEIKSNKLQLEVRKIAPNSIALQEEKYWNVLTDQADYVINGTTKETLILPNSIRPTALSIVPGFEKHFVYSHKENNRRVIHISNMELFSPEETNQRISNIENNPGEKLVNALNDLNEQVVLDMRKGMSAIRLAYSNYDQVRSVKGNSVKVGLQIWQNAEVNTLGGTKSVVLNLEDPDLSKCALPPTLKSNISEDQPSIFHSSLLTEINLQKPISLGNNNFLQAKFVVHQKKISKVLIDQSSGEPLQLESHGHKFELLITVKNQATFHKLGKHKLIKGFTLTEELQESEILFSLKSFNSNILLNDTYLPPFKNAVQIQTNAPWKYILFEISSNSIEKEFIAVEKLAPHRILVERKGKKEYPKIILSSKQALKQPEEISLIKKIFLKDPGYLVAVE